MSENFGYVQKFRMVMFREEINRLELSGTFTSEDLRKLADWLDGNEKQVLTQLIPIIKLKLSPIVPPQE